MTPPPTFSPGQLESLCKILADTETGLTGTEIGHMLGQARIDDVNPTATKWKRLYNALAEAENRARSADRTFAFIRLALEPARYVGQHDVFQSRRSSVNAVLLLHGYEYRDDGRFARATVAATLSEAESRAHRLRAALSARGVHPDVVASCRAELLQHNVFHAVLEASKSVGEKLRRRTGLQGDGAPLVDATLGGDSPKLRINAFVSDTEKGEQRGFANLTKGLFGVFRNPTAHTPRSAWEMTEEDALDLFSLASYLHRRVDRATSHP